MVSLGKIKDEMRSAIVKIGENPLSDAIVKSALGSVPQPFGDFLVRLYENAAGSASDKSTQIIQLLDNLQSFSERELQRFSEEIAANKSLLIKNDKALSDLLLLSQNIRNTINQMHHNQISMSEAIRRIESSITEFYSMSNRATEDLKELLQMQENKVMHEFRKISNNAEKYNIEVPAERLSFYLRLRDHLQMAYRIFLIQVQMSDKLFESLKNRGIETGMGSKDELLFRLYEKMIEEEREMTVFLRQTTENTNELNSFANILLKNNIEFLQDLPILRKLYEHFCWWRAKYDLYKDDPRMCIIFVGPKQGKLFPPEVDELLEQKIMELKRECLLVI
jgi:predicted transcriptional regulator